MSLGRQFVEVSRLAWRECRENPALLAAIFMRPMGFRWDLETHKWVDRKQPSGSFPMRMVCRQCRKDEATVAIHSGFEFHPTCDECAEWWHPNRKYSLAEVDPNYKYGDEIEAAQ